MRTGAERGDQLIGGAELGPLRCRLQQPGRRGGERNYLPHRRSSCRSCCYLAHLFSTGGFSAAKD